MIKAVIFDVDGVLLDSFEANFNFFRELMPMAGYKEPTREEYTPLFFSPMIGVIRALAGNASEEEVQRIFEMGKSHRVIYRYDSIGTPAGMAETVLALSKQYRLGIVTSRIKGYLFGYPQLKELKDCFETAVYFEDTTRHKPHPEPLLLATEKLKVKPAEAVYIGDAESDRQAAEAAGMHFIYYSNRAGAGTAGAGEFTDLPGLITRLG